MSSCLSICREPPRRQALRALRKGSRSKIRRRRHGKAEKLLAQGALPFSPRPGTSRWRGYTGLFRGCKPRGGFSRLPGECTASMVCARQTQCGANAMGRGLMTRRLWTFPLIIALSAVLTACDKCNDLQQIQLPLRPNTCKDATAR